MMADNFGDVAGWAARWRAVGGWLGALLAAVFLVLVAGVASADAGGLGADKNMTVILQDDTDSGAGLDERAQNGADSGAESERWAQMSERERNMEIFSSMVFPAGLDALPSNHPGRLLHRWEGDQVIEIGAFEHIADGEYRSVVPGDEHYDDLEDVIDQFRQVVPEIDFRIVPGGNVDIGFVFSNKNIYDLMTSRFYFSAINFITDAKNKADAGANYDFILEAKAKKWHCVSFHGYKADGGIAKGISFYQNNPEVLHSGWNEKEKERIREGNWWKQCAATMVMSSLGIAGQPPRGIPSIWNTMEPERLSDADKFVIRALYSGRVKSGMTKAETLSRLFPAE